MQLAADHVERMNGLLKNSLLLLFSIIFSLVMGELLLRALTPFPVGTKSHRASDADLGYRLSSSLRDVDERGFRNRQGKHGAYTIAAIGDSNTYGNNVETSDTWPAQLESAYGVKTYNFGVGGFGIYSYHALVERALRDHAGGIMVALFPANDFGAIWSHCEIAESPSPFWRKERARLHLQSLDPSVMTTGLCARGMPTVGWKTWLVEHTAVASAIYMIVVPAVRNALSPQDAARQGGDYYRFPQGVPSISRKYVAENAALSNLDKPETARLFNDFSSFLQDWDQRAAGRVGILIVPSKERVIFEALRRRGALDQADPFFIASVTHEMTLERKVIELAKARGIPVREAIGPMSAALEDAIRQDESFYPEDDGHPYRSGYRAIASTAADLWNEMKRDAGP